MSERMTKDEAIEMIYTMRIGSSVAEKEAIDILMEIVEEKESPEEYVKQKLREYTQWIFETTNVGCIDEPECMDSCVDCLINRYEREKEDE